MFNFWNPLQYYGCRLHTLENNSIVPFWQNLALQNQLMFNHNPNNNTFRNQIFSENSIVKIQSEQVLPKKPFNENLVKIEEVEPDREIIASEDQQDCLTKIDLMRLKGSYQKLKWSQQDDNTLIDLYQNQGYKMQEIAQKFEGASEKICMTRYKRLKRTELKYWTREQDSIIRNTVAQIGQKWKDISKLLPNRTAKQIRQHYINSLRPQIKKTPWTPQQDLMVNKLVKQKGKQWRLFQRFLVGRTENHIKNRYYGRIKKIQQIKKKIKNSY